MKIKMVKVWVSLVGGIAVVCLTAQGQEINFRDLGRTGVPVIKRYTVEGISNDGREYLGKFDGVDTDRLAQQRASSRANSTSEKSSASSDTRSANASVGKTIQWRCEFLCGKSRHSVYLDAPDKSSAQNSTYRYGKKNCWALSKELFESMWGRIADCEKQ